MAYRIQCDKCISCGACAARGCGTCAGVCPVEAPVEAND